MPSKSSDYKGIWSTTASGRRCQRWDSQFPHLHTYNNSDLFPDHSILEASNHCRNPGNPRDGRLRLYPWCFTADDTVEWEYCPIFTCGMHSTSFFHSYIIIITLNIFAIMVTTILYVNNINKQM